MTVPFIALRSCLSPELPCLSAICCGFCSILEQKSGFNNEGKPCTNHFLLDVEEANYSASLAWCVVPGTTLTPCVVPVYWYFAISWVKNSTLIARCQVRLLLFKRTEFPMVLHACDVTSVGSDCANPWTKAARLLLFSRIFQGWILEWVTINYPRGSSWPG